MKHASLLSLVVVLAIVGSAAAEPAGTLFADKVVSLPAPASRLRFGMTLAEAKAAAPAIFKKGLYGKQDSFLYEIPNTTPRARVQIHLTDGKIDGMMSMVDGHVEDVLPLASAAWGAPRTSRDEATNRTIYTWFDGAAGLRAQMTADNRSMDFRFRPAMTLDALLGTHPGKLGLMPILGATHNTVLKTYASWIAKSGGEAVNITLPVLDVGPLDHQSDYGAINVMFRDDIAIRYDVVFRVEDPAIITTIRERLEKLFGPAKPVTGGSVFKGNQEWNLPGPPEVKLTLTAEKIVGIAVDWRKPL